MLECPEKCHPAYFLQQSIQAAQRTRVPLCGAGTLANSHAQATSCQRAGNEARKWNSGLHPPHTVLLPPPSKRTGRGAIRALTLNNLVIHRIAW